jgi:hypothetical protein
MDDVRYVSLLPVPLTTVHQDCSGIGAVAMATMLERLDRPKLPVRDVLVGEIGRAAVLRRTSGQVTRRVRRTKRWSGDRRSASPAMDFEWRITWAG